MLNDKDKHNGWEGEFDSRYIAGELGTIFEEDSKTPLKNLKDFIHNLLKAQEERVRKEERERIAEIIPSSRDMACDCEGDYKCACCCLQEDQDKFFKNLL